MTTKDKYTFPKGPIGKDESAKLKNILDSMEKDPQAYDFLTPVNYVGKNIYKTFRTWLR